MKGKQKFLVSVLFLIYLALLVWIILFKLQFNINDLDTVRSINLIPFYYDKEIGTVFHLKEVFENLLIFVPMGIYLQMLLPKCRFHGKLIIIAGTSLLLEVAQYVLAIGRSDITDLITNFMGGLLGLALYGMMARLLKNRETADKLFFILAVIVSVVVVGFLALRKSGLVCTCTCHWFYILWWDLDWLSCWITFFQNSITVSYRGSICVLMRFSLST